MVEAEPLVDFLGRRLVRWSKEFEESMERARKNGDLEDFFDRAIFALDHLFSISGHLGSALGNIFKAGRADGQHRAW